MSDKGKAKKGKKDEKKNEEPKEKVEKKEEGAQEEGEAKPTQNLGPQDLQQGEELFGVCHICATFNDTFIHVTDLSGRETYARVTGGMKVICSYVSSTRCLCQIKTIRCYCYTYKNERKRR